MSASRLDRWLAPRIAARAADAEREIADDPTEVAWFRGSVELAHITVRITAAAASAFTSQRSQYGVGRSADVLILASSGTDLRAKDRLQKEGGETWVLSAVSPDRTAKTEAIGEVVSR